MFEELVPRIGSIELTGPVERLRSNFFNAIKRMPVGSPRRSSAARLLGRIEHHAARLEALALGRDRGSSKRKYERGGSGHQVLDENRSSG